MKRPNWIAMDVHSRFCEGGWTTSGGLEKGTFRVPTSVPQICEELQKVPRPRMLVIEEGPLAEWLVRELSEQVDQMIVADPFRNALIARDGDKCDAIDWRKLAELARGGHIRPVHHNGTLERAVLKQHVLLYHQRVRHRQSEALRIIWWCRRFGLVILERHLKDASQRSQVFERLPRHELIRKDLDLLLKGYDLAAEQVRRMRRRLSRLCRTIEPVRRFMALPGVKLIRAATFYAMIDTPFRFKRKQALWKYSGIGLEKRQSGNRPARLRVPRRCNKLLKYVILGAARSASRTQGNIFAEQYQRWLKDGCSIRIARRNLARSQAAVMWGMWKSDTEYDPDLVHLEVGEKRLTEACPRRWDKSGGAVPFPPQWTRQAFAAVPSLE